MKTIILLCLYLSFSNCSQTASATKTVGGDAPRGTEPVSDQIDSIYAQWHDHEYGPLFVQLWKDSIATGRVVKQDFVTKAAAAWVENLANQSIEESQEKAEALAADFYNEQVIFVLWFQNINRPPETGAVIDLNSNTEDFYETTHDGVLIVTRQVGTEAVDNYRKRTEWADQFFEEQMKCEAFYCINVLAMGDPLNLHIVQGEVIPQDFANVQEWQDHLTIIDYINTQYRTADLDGQNLLLFKNPSDFTVNAGEVIPVEHAPVDYSQEKAIATAASSKDETAFNALFREYVTQKTQADTYYGRRFQRLISRLSLSNEDLVSASLDYLYDHYNNLNEMLNEISSHSIPEAQVIRLGSKFMNAFQYEFDQVVYRARNEQASLSSMPQIQSLDEIKNLTLQYIPHTPLKEGVSQQSYAIGDEFMVIVKASIYQTIVGPAESMIITITNVKQHYGYNSVIDQGSSPSEWTNLRPMGVTQIGGENDFSTVEIPKLKKIGLSADFL